MTELGFENNSVPLDQLPKAEEVVVKKPNENFLFVTLVSNTIFLCFIALSFMGGYFFLSEEMADEINLDKALTGILILFCLIVLYSFIMAFYNYKLRGYALRENDIIYKKGVLFQTLTTIPFNRVQHCELNQGPIDRLFNLNSLLIYTAGGQGSDVKIVGLEPTEANQLKEYIVSSTLLSTEQTYGEEE